MAAARSLTNTEIKLRGDGAGPTRVDVRGVTLPGRTVALVRKVSGIQMLGGSSECHSPKGLCTQAFSTQTPQREP